ncbi:MAG: 16S rRNA (guanine(527)-N(7))-methyltransferase RsmG [Planctomycetota bacterium]
MHDDDHGESSGDDVDIPSPEELENEIESVVRAFEKRRGEPLPAGAVTRLSAHAHLMLMANASMNLTRITNPRDIAIKHILDSLTILDAVALEKTRVLDMGTGAGYPGIPLAIAVPSASVVLMDGSEKKTIFVNDVIENLQLTNAAAMQGRAEVHLKDYDYNFIVARAVGPISRLLPLLLSRRKQFEVLVAMKGPGGKDEWGEAYKSGASRGFELLATHETELPGGAGKRSILLIAPSGTKHLKPLSPSKSGSKYKNTEKNRRGR